MSGYPNRSPGYKGQPETGRLGAEHFKPKLGTRQAEALHSLGELGVASADEIATATGRHWYLVRPRLSELSAMGLVADSGDRAQTSMGGRTIRWRLTTESERAEFAARQAAEVGAMVEAVR